ncbi:hypothetical protein [Stenotrophomonas sp. ZAC14A_NAIMI4_1]|uniref:hypothetical protein n=1 Tax=Stenotrophomonas sp. ZAC14A_NAIMI4_1 TaxID=2072412 RepID=UPI0020B12D55|nr:hypothetical protein [Stenotrophomonas sp. ZAC14A_NAIMI4_1]
MLELDRHLSQSLEQARHAPLNVQRYGHSWVWMLCSDAWADAMRWGALDCSAHPLMLLRRELDPLLQPWPDAVAPLLPLEAVDMRILQRAALLVAMRGLHSPQRLHDDLRHQQAYRRFIGLGHGLAWTPTDCVRLLHACAHPLLVTWTDATLAGMPAVLRDAACAPRVRARFAEDPPQRTAGGCLSY